MKKSFALLPVLALPMAVKLFASDPKLAARWDFGTEESSPLAPAGKVVRDQPGPRPPEFPGFEANNTAAKFGGDGARFVVEDPGPDSLFDFGNGDAITLEAWVYLDAIRTGQPMYVVGKGRTGSPRHAKDNQNWALRVVGNGGLAKLSFLFATKPGPGDSHWHRWTSNTGFQPGTGWHHIAVAYEFGKPGTIRGWVDGMKTDGTWDLGGATQSPPVVDDDEIWIGSSMGGSATNSFTGSLDAIAINREILPDATMAKRFERVGGPRVVEVPVPEMPALEGIQEGSVLVQFSEGLPAFDKWPGEAETPEETARWTGDSFLLPRVPQRYDDWGIRSAWKDPLLIRMAADVELPAGASNFLVRTRGLARLWVDGKLVAETKPAETRAPDGEEKPTPLAEPPHPGVRVKGYRQQEVAGTAQLEKAGTYRIVLELVAGGKNQRTETGEVCVAIETRDGTSYSIPRAASKPSLPLTDSEVLTAMASIENSLLKFEDENRRKAASSREGFWDKRHEIAKQWAKANPAPKVPTGFSQNPVDAFLDKKIEKAKAYAASQSGTPGPFHKEVLPILRKQCFRCHGEKDKGKLKLDTLQAALKGGESELPALVPGKPAESELLIRMLSKDEDLVMPPTGDPVPAEEIAKIEKWIREGAEWPEKAIDPAKLEQPPLANDWEFLRRVYLDTIGLPPSEEEIRAFTADRSAGKRAKLVDKLLADDRSADHAMAEWMDLLAENPTLLNLSLNSTGPFRWFLFDALRDNQPLDRMVTELVMMRGDEAHGGSAGFALAGENDAPYAAKGHILASAFLGIELQCARCHDSPYHSTTQRDLYSLAAMLERKTVTVSKTSQVPAGFFEKKARESLIRVTLKPGDPVRPEWPFQQATGITEGKGTDRLLENPSDSRERLAALLTGPENLRFPRVIVNRIWKRLIGTGFVEPAHDWEGNEPSHPELLDWLAHELVSHGYDSRHVLRLVLNSRIYQREANGTNWDTSPKDRFFNAPDKRRLTAEQIVDSFHYAAGTDIDSEELTFVHDGRRPLGKRQTLGTPTRAWMFASLNNERDRPSLSLPRAQAVADVLQAFGWSGSRQKPIPQRDNEPNVLQPGILANGTLADHLTRVSVGSSLAGLAATAESPELLLETSFLRFLGRLPTPSEKEALLPPLAEGFKDRILPANKTVSLPLPPDQLPLVTWFNHLSPEANTIQQTIESQVRRGPPPDPRFQKHWRETYEDLLWSLANHREFVWMP